MPLGTANLLQEDQSYSANGTNSTVTYDTAKVRTAGGLRSVKIVATADGSTEHKTGYGFTGTGNDPVAGKPYVVGVYIDPNGDTTYDVRFIVNYDTVDAAGVAKNVQRAVAGVKEETDAGGWTLWTGDAGIAPDGTRGAQLIPIINGNSASDTKWADDHYFGDPAAPVNKAPTATVTAPAGETVGKAATIVGGGSDPEGTTLTYSWSLARPTGSAATLSSLTAQSPTITYDVEGVYTYTLTTSDGSLTSSPASASTTVTRPAEVSVELKWSAASGKVTEYQLERALSSASPYVSVGVTPTPGYNDAEGANGALYRVRGANATEVGPWSNVATAAPPVTG